MDTCLKNTMLRGSVHVNTYYKCTHYLCSGAAAAAVYIYPVLLRRSIDSSDRWHRNERTRAMFGIFVVFFVFTAFILQRLYQLTGRAGEKKTTRVKISRLRAPASYHSIINSYTRWRWSPRVRVYVYQTHSGQNKK